jgi:hypothetical protein
MQTNSTKTPLERIKQPARLCKECFRVALRLALDSKVVERVPHHLSGGMAELRRLLRLKYLEAHNVREIKSLLAGGVAPTFVTSCMRSGNTWMRYLLSDVLLQNEGIKTTTDLVIHPDEIIPEYHNDLVAVRLNAQRMPHMPGVLLKIHDSFDELGRRFWGQGYQTNPSFRKCRHLYLFRSPEDALVSLYRFHLRKRLMLDRAVKRAGQLAIDEFCRQALPRWIQHVCGYLDAADSGVPIYFASYEQLLADAEQVLEETLRWLEVPHSRSMVERACTNMQFQKLKGTREKNMGDRGRSGGGSIELQPATVTFIRASTEELMARAQRHAVRLPAPLGELAALPVPLPT